MSTEILINATSYETRVALVQDGVLQEILIERPRKCSLVGNIYLGRVEKVLPGLQAAFVDIGLKKSAFIHVSDIMLDGEDDHNRTGDDNTLVAKLIHEGQRLIVQVYKDEIGNKGPRITNKLSVPSRYLVMMPNIKKLCALSAKIQDENERARLLQILQSLSNDEPEFGLIARTNAEGAGKVSLLHDHRYLKKLYDKLQKKIARTRKASLIFSELDLGRRIVRDQINENLIKITTDSAEMHASIGAFIDEFATEWDGQLVHYSAAMPLFDHYNIEHEIEQALSRHVDLKSGGNLVIDMNEAMTTVDVNTGQFTGHRSLEDTAYKTNLEAAQAIARQLRLRNIAGIVIVDFIDMKDPEHREKVILTLVEALAEDPAKTKVLGLTALGLVELTRKRTTESLMDVMSEDCRHCGGSGRVRTIESVCFKVFREIIRSVKQFKTEKIVLIAASNLVNHLIEEYSETLAGMEETLGKRIQLQAEESYSRDHFDVVLL